MTEQPPSVPQPNYPPTYPSGYAPRPPKDRSIALILELLPGLFGLLGFGWIYSGETGRGIVWLGGMFVWSIIAIGIAVLTGGLSCFCTFPVSISLIAISVASLSSYTRQRPELFGP
jgi:hypothetical protein